MTTSLLIAADAEGKAVQVTMDLYAHLLSEATWQAMERLQVISLIEAPRAIGPAAARTASGAPL